MPTNDPVAALRAVRQHVAALQAAARDAAKQPGAHIRSLGNALIGCARALGGPDTLAAAKAGLAVVRAAHDDAAALAARHGSPWRDEAAAALKAETDLAAIVKGWGPPPALSTVSVALGFGDVQVSATEPTTITATLVRDHPDLAASAHWRITGLDAADLQSVAEDDATFPAGQAQATETIVFAPMPGLTAPKIGGFALGPPLVGSKLGSPAGFPFRLLPPVVVPVRSVVSVAQDFDAVVLSADAPTTGQAVLVRTGGADALEVPVVVAGLQDGDLAAPVGPARFEAGASQAGVTLQFGPGTPGAPDRAARLAIDASGGAFDVVDPAGFDFAVREPAVVAPPAGPPAIDPASYANQAQADPVSFSRVTNSMRPGTAVLLAPGHYGFTNIHVPGCLYYAAGPGTVFVDGRVELHTPDTAVLLLDIGGGLVLDGDRSRASRCSVHGSSGVDLVSVQGADNVLDWCEVYDFAGIGIGVRATSARRPVMFGLHVHSQRSSGPPASATVFMVGHNHTDSDQPVAGRYERILMEGSRSHDGFEIKSSDNTVTDVTAIGCDVMQRHGIRAATFVRCWAEAQGGQGGRIQLNSNNPKAVRCHGHLAIAAGNGSVEDLLHKGGGNSIYPFAAGAEGHHHDGVVEVGNLHSSSRPMPPVGTKLDSCPVVRTTAGTYGPATPIPADQLPPPARRLTPADVGPGAA